MKKKLHIVYTANNRNDITYVKVDCDTNVTDGEVVWTNDNPDEDNPSAVLSSFKATIGRLYPDCELHFTGLYPCNVNNSPKC